MVAQELVRKQLELTAINVDGGFEKGANRNVRLMYSSTPFCKIRAWLLARLESSTSARRLSRQRRLPGEQAS